MNESLYEDEASVLGTGFLLIFLAVLIGASSATWRAINSGLVSKIAFFPELVSAIATVALVLLTGGYAYLTKRLVEENQEQRKQQVRMENRRLETKKRVLRRALLQEVKFIQNWARNRVEDGKFRIAHPGFSTSIYETNTDQIGLLDDPEITSLINFYNNVEALREMIQFRREVPDTDDDPFEKQLRLVQNVGSDTIEALEERVEND